VPQAAGAGHLSSAIASGLLPEGSTDTAEALRINTGNGVLASAIASGLLPEGCTNTAEARRIRSGNGVLASAIAAGDLPAGSTDVPAAMRIRITAGVEAARGLPSDTPRWRCAGSVRKGRNCVDSGWTTTTKGGMHKVIVNGNYKLCGLATVPYA